jgi:hypothetical protein
VDNLPLFAFAAAIGEFDGQSVAYAPKADEQANWLNTNANSA